MLPEVVAYLKQYSFPGNIRELENFVERAITVTNDQSLRLSAFPDQIQTSERRDKLKMPSLILDEARKYHNDIFEHNYLVELLKNANGRINVAAEIARVDRRTISRLLQKHKLTGKSFK